MPTIYHLNYNCNEELFFFNWVNLDKLTFLIPPSYIEIIYYLVEHGSYVNAKNEELNTPLHFAAKNGN